MIPFDHVGDEDPSSFALFASSIPDEGDIHALACRSCRTGRVRCENRSRRGVGIARGTDGGRRGPTLAERIAAEWFIGDQPNPADSVGLLDELTAAINTPLPQSSLHSEAAT